ncbi:PRD domain-containing protein [Lacrimispora sp.]|uniref:PRD domain-containing protein n=1 Tax=Lacrimispora sp. TaxID=2719234 RepID=UPI00289D2734|nr:PRD domain-containing protein [Lacrimispora sp.]
MGCWKIVKILNNNVVFVVDSKNQEYIAVGNGIGFRHKVRENLSDDEIIKIFAQINNQVKNKLVTILEEIPFDRIELTMQLVEHAEKSLDRKLNENLAVSLADHIHYLLERYKEGIMFPSIASEEIKRFYQEEYAIGCELVDIINKKYNIELDYEEASTIAFHIINASNQRGQKTLEIMYGVRDLVNIVTESLHIEPDMESFDYSRFIIHLKFFMKKVFLNSSEASHDNNSLLQRFELEFPAIQEIVQNIEMYILSKYQYQMGDDDKLYLFIHIRRLLKR